MRNGVTACRRKWTLWTKWTQYPLAASRKTSTSSTQSTGSTPSTWQLPPLTLPWRGAPGTGAVDANARLALESSDRVHYRASGFENIGKQEASY
jgi:hypothetical protein